MPRLNRRVFLKSIVTVALVSVALGAVHRIQRSRQTALYASQASFAASKGEMQEAIQGYKRAIAAGGEQANWLAELSSLYESVGSTEACYLASQRLERLAPDRPRNRVRLAECALRLGRYRDAIEWVEQCGVQPTSERTASLLVIKADALSGLLENEEAEKCYREAIEANVQDPSVDVRLAKVLDERLKDTESALTVLDEMVERIPTAEAVLLRGQFYFQKAGGLTLDSVDQSLVESSSWLAGAVKDSEIARTMSHDSPESLQFAAAVLLFQGREQEAISVADRGIDALGSASTFYRLGSLAAERAAAKAIKSSDPEIRKRASRFHTRSDQFLKLGLKRLPDSTDLLWQKATCLLDREAAGTEDFSAVIDQLSQNQFSEPLLQFLNARRLAAEARFVEAIKQLESVRVEVIEDSQIVRLVDLSLAMCYEAIGNNDDRLASLRRIVAGAPNWLAIRERLAEAYLDAGRTEDAIREYQTIAARPGIPIRAPLNFARMLLIQNLNQTKNTRDWRSFESLLDSLSTHTEVNSEVAVLRAEMMLARDRPDAAFEILEDSPSTEAVRSALAMLCIHQSEFERAESVIVAEAKGRGFSPRLKFANVLLMMKRDPERRRVSDAPEELDTGYESDWDTEQRMTYNDLMIPLLLQYGQLDRLQELVDFQLQIQPGNIKAQARKLQLIHQRGDREQLSEFLKHLRSTDGDPVLSHYGEALLVSMKATGDHELNGADYHSAQASLAAATALRPDSASITTLSAQLSDRAGKPEVAIAKYKRAISLGQRDFIVIRRLVDLLSTAGRYAEADAVMRSLRQSKQPFSAELSRLASEISVQLSQLDRAIDLAVQAAKESNGVNDYLWLARVRRLSGDPVAAESAYQKAIGVDARSAEARLAWIGFLQEQSRLDEAYESLRDFEAIIGDQDVAGQIAAAQAYSLLGDSDAAGRLVLRIDASKLSDIEQYESYFGLLTAPDGEDFLRNVLSEQVGGLSQPALPNRLDGLVDSRDRHRASVRRWARRQLATSLSSRRDGNGSNASGQYGEATALLERNLKESPGDLADRYTLAIVQSRFLGSDNPSIPLNTFDSLRRDGWASTPSDEFLMGRLHAVAGNWSEARDLMLPLLGDEQFCQPKHIKIYARLLLDRDDYVEASLWIDRLVRQRVHDQETAALLCEIQFRRGQFDQVLDDLTGRIDAKTGNSWFQKVLSPRQRFEMLVQLTTRLNQSERSGEASRFEKASVALARTLSEGRGFSAMFYLRELVRRGEVDSAIAALPKQVGRATSAELVRFAETLIAQSACTPAHLASVERLFSARAKRDPEDAPIRIAIARMRECRGDEEAAVRLYSSILANGRRNMVAENNLAALLALTGDPERGTLLCDRAIEEFGERMFLLDTRGICHLQANRLEEAIVDFRRAYAIVPHPVVLFHEAWAKDLLNQPQASKHAFSMATSQGLQRNEVHLLERDEFDRLTAKSGQR